MPVDLAIRIAEKSQRNLRRALLMLQTCVTQKLFHFSFWIAVSSTTETRIYSIVNFRVPLTKEQSIVEPDWEIYLRETARMIGEQQTPQR